MIAHHLTAPRAALVAALAAALAAQGCAGAEAPAAPSASGCPAARVSLCTDAAYALRVRSAVADAADRIGPALENPGARTALTERLAVLSLQLDVGDVARARQSLAGVEAALATARAAATATDAADLDAIAIVIHETASALAGAP